VKHDYIIQNNRNNKNLYKFITKLLKRNRMFLLLLLHAEPGQEDASVQIYGLIRIIFIKHNKFLFSTIYKIDK
jgi:hypothetical protein